MRKAFVEAYRDIDALGNHKEIMVMNPTSPKESFLLTLANIALCN
jgi:hypothetical protein